MPIIPSVFQPIKANDYQQRPIKAYKRYRIKSAGFNTSSGYFRHNALYSKATPHIFSDTGLGVGTLEYPVNAETNTNQHVVWNTINHRYYKNNNPAHAADFLDISQQQRFIWYSASIFTYPYGAVGEKIKHGSFHLTSSIGSTTIELADDLYGNLRDNVINSNNFASSSRNFFHMSFNTMYRNFAGPVTSLAGNSVSGSVVPYSLNLVANLAKVNSGMMIGPGVTTTGPSAFQEKTSGLAAMLNNNQYIRIPHNDKFDRFGHCDDWTISFWYASNRNIADEHKEIVSKYGIKSEQYYDKIDKKRKFRDRTFARTTNFENVKTPFNISVHRSGSNDASSSFSFKASNGSHQLHISSSMINAPANTWNHITIRNSSSICQMFIDGNSDITSQGVIPEGITSNDADIMIGSVNGKYDFGHDTNQKISEIRMYDYAVNSTGISSLSNRNYLSGSLYQTNIPGNVFYKNAQVVVSSPMPKYHSGSGMFENTWDMNYRGTHMIYENECLVRVPKDIFNVTMNPTSTYRPVTVGDPCSTNQTNMSPGELRKHLFVSGTLKPYITTIGLYDDNARLLATGKLAQPIQKNQDVDMNFIVRWDY